MSLPENWPATVAVPGVVSEGTLKTDDLIAAFEPVLREVSPEDYNYLVSTRVRGSDEDDHEYLLKLQDALDDLAPEGYYFGTVEGDGSCFGFFESPDYEGDEDEMPESNEVCAARGMIALYERLKNAGLESEFGDDWSSYHEAYVAAGEVLNARELA